MYIFKFVMENYKKIKVFLWNIKLDLYLIFKSQYQSKD